MQIAILISLFLLCSIVSIEESNKALSEVSRGQISTHDKLGFEENEINAYDDDEIEVYNLQKNNETVGRAIWLFREPKNIKIKYFTTPYIKNDYAVWKNKEEIREIYSCNAGTATQINGITTTDGLNITGGNVVNEKVSKELDAVVLVEPIGGIRVSKLNDGNLKLLDYASDLDIRNEDHLKTLFNWSRSVGATIFQTNLVAWNDKLNLYQGDANQNIQSQRSRRFLALLHRSGNLYYVIIEIDKPFSITSIGIDILFYLNEQHKSNVTALLELDRKAYDCSYLYEPDGLLPKDKNCDILSASSIITFYKFENSNKNAKK